MEFLTYASYLAQWHLIHSFAMRLFLASCVLLAIGVCLKVWFHAVKLVWLDAMTLQQVEAEHPYIPDTKVIMRIGIATIMLLLLGSFLLTQFAPFKEAYEFVYLCGIFAIVGTLAIISELHWQQYRHHLFAVLAASAVGYIVFAIRFFIQTENIVPSLFFLGFLLIAVVTSFQLLTAVRKLSVNIVFLCTILWWFLVHLVYQV